MTLPLLGHYLLLLALAGAFANVALTLGPKRAVLQSWVHRAALLTWLALAGASAVLLALFWTDNFAVKYVWEHSAKGQPLPFKLAAFWGGQAGSLLMWSGVLGTYTLLVARWGQKNKIEIAPTAVAILSFVNVFFIGLILLQANPFGTVEGKVPTDGFGLNPLLQNYWMQIHPPTLYTGYIGCAVPFALAMAALLHRQFDERWVKLVRRWTLLTWIILFTGIVLGGVWAYETLGWGGYWAWDPVENASLMPWLTLTAFVHSIMLQERRGLLKNWNITLVALTFLLSVFGTFLTRSGIVSSVHSFAESDIGNYFLGFLAVCLVLTFGTIWWRREELSTRARIESTLSREAGILAGNCLLLASALAVLFGTIYPTIYEALVGTKTVVEQSYFNRALPPLGLLLLALAGIGPLMGWQKSTPLQALRAVKKPLWFAVFAIPVCISPLLYYLGQWHTGAATAFLLGAFLFGAMMQELWFSAQAGTLWRNRRRTGGYIVHLGLMVLFVGLTGSSVFKTELEPRDLKVGDTLPIGEYTLRFDGFLRPTELAPNKKSDVATKISILRHGQPVTDRTGNAVFLTPNVDIYKAAGSTDPEAMAGQPEQTARRPAILSTLSNDLYLALIGYDMNKGVATIKAYLNPLVAWIWIAVGFFILGSLVCLLPDKVFAPRAVELAPLKPVPASYSTNGNGNGKHAPSEVLSSRANLDIEIEIAIARAKVQLLNAQWRCECGRTMQSGDKFCASCGAAKSVPTT